ncbi:hypothetical protein ABS772_05630 [Methylorubrum podarium]|uniref:EAL domain-containing protein n=1 Tax=Methylorubrum podarium TaxID=200476 RepID=A0ABV1QJ55_9HYPH
MLELGRGLGLPVAAEGVETPAELRFPAEESCQSVQGVLAGQTRADRPACTAYP